MSEKQILARLWELYTATKGNVYAELERLFPNDPEQQEAYKDKLIDMARSGGPEEGRKCRVCNRILRTVVGRECHENRVHGIPRIDRYAIAADYMAQESGSWCYTIAEIAKRNDTSPATVSVVAKELGLQRMEKAA